LIDLEAFIRSEFEFITFFIQFRGSSSSGHQLLLDLSDVAFGDATAWAVPENMKSVCL
jgi:hypothetical protein